MSIHEITRKKLTQFRLALAYINALPQLTLLGLFIGLFTGIIIVIFRLIIEWPLTYYASHHAESYTYDNYTNITVGMRWAIIMAGATVIAGIFHWAGKERTRVGVSHTIDRLHNYQGNLPSINWVLQFIGASICMLSGQSVGREGPAVHLGAGVASQIGAKLRLPNNSRHTLIACGVAAGISASFDTPLAGVIFAMEVVLMEYTIVGFVPVILSAVVGTIVSRTVFGEASLFIIGDTSIASLAELPYMIIIGLVIGCCAAGFIKLNILASSLTRVPMAIRILGAGVITSCVATYVPEIMGLGYDTVNNALGNNIALNALIIIAIAKLFTTPVVVGLGMPAGVIGPVLVCGACLGGIFGAVISEVFPELGANATFYVVLGMAGLLAATINAPLAALVAVLELSANPNMIFPAMLVIVVSCLATRQLFSLDGIFTEQLRASNQLPDDTATKSVLKRAGVMSIIDRKFVVAQQTCDYEKAKTLLTIKPRWVVIESGDEKFAMPAADLAKYIEDAPVEVLSLEQEIDLFNIPARRHLLRPIHETANLYEALKAMKVQETEMLYVAVNNAPIISDVTGLIRIIDIENYYQPAEFKTV